MVHATKLRELIRQIRATKTASDERAVVSKECAQVRTSIRDEDTDNRCRNVAKLLYIHMLGYPAHFGQLECLKLCSSSRFIDKRIGYLGVSVLLDERAEVALLVTNCLKNDMGNSNQYVVGLALSTLGAIASAEMARDLSAEVEQLLKSSNAYIRKKAALCAVRIVRKEPELLENFVSSTKSLLSERNHAVLLTGVTLIIEMCAHSEDTIYYFRRMVPQLVRLLKNLVMSGFSPDHDVSGVTDPFLQVKLLRLLRILGHHDGTASDAMNDILAQVATNTETQKNVGNAILYETVMAIMDIESEKDLRVLAINILGRFLASNDKNIRYVALNTLLKTVKFDNQAVQRHRNTVVDCLSDSDISIRRRALELTFALVNETNVRGLVRELLTFLHTGDPEFKPYMTSELLKVAQKFAPNRRWHTDTVLKVLTAGGNYVKEDTIPMVIHIFASQEPQLQAYATQKLFLALQENISQQALVQVGAWCVGEFGDLLVAGLTADDVPIEVNEGDVVGVLHSIMQSPLTNAMSRAITLNAVMKLSTRFQNTLSDIKDIVNGYTKSIDSELQQRSVEYSSLFSMSAIRSQVLERMPIADSKAQNVNETYEAADERTAAAASANAPVAAVSVAPVATTAAPAAAEPSLLDLMDIEPSPVMSAPASSGAAPAAALLDIFGESLSSGAPAPAAAPAASSALLDLMGDLPTSTMAPPAAVAASPSLVPAASAPAPTSAIPSIVAFQKAGLRVDFDFDRQATNPSVLIINCKYSNATPHSMENFNFQAAVPKTLKLQMQPSSSPSIPSNGVVTQVIKIANPQQKQLRVRIRISYELAGTAILEQGEVSHFPPESIASTDF